MYRLLNLLLIIAGLTLFFSVPAIWAAWGPTQLWAILGIGAAAGVVYVLLYSFSDLSKPPGHA